MQQKNRKEQTICKEYTVKEALQASPQAVSVFLRYKTHCTGCWLVRFCTLEEVAQNYQLDLDAFLSALKLENFVSIREE